jgi:hypothetical protein
MITQHSPDGRHFLGLRAGRKGGYEIIYDGTPQIRRFVWQLKSEHVDLADIRRQFAIAMRAPDVLSTLNSGLQSAQIEFEVDYDDPF